GHSKAARTQRRLLRARRHGLPWIHAAHRRRAVLTALVLIPSIIASGFMVSVLPHQGGSWLEVAIVVFFGALFGWISIGFWTAILGFWVLVRGHDRFAITNLETAPLDAAAVPPPDEVTPGEPATAIIMPVCAEPVERIFAGLR